MKVNQEKPFQRILRMESLLRSGSRLTIDDLANRLGIDSRSVFRYLDRLAFMGRKISTASRQGRVKEYWIQTERSEAPLDLIQSLQKMDQTLTEGGSRKFHRLIQDVIQFCDPTKKKTEPIARLIPSSSQSTPITFEADPYFHLDHGPLAEHNGPGTLVDRKMDQVLSAIRSQNQIRITYSKTEKSGKKTQSFLFYPYFLSLRVGKLYLIGYAPETSPRKLISIVFKRIGLITLEGKTFQRDPKVNLDNFYKHCFGQWVPRTEAKKIDIVLAIHEPWIKDYLAETFFNPTLEWDADGNAHLSLFDTPDLETWLFGLHPALEIKSPRTLRERIRMRAKKSLQILQ